MSAVPDVPSLEETMSKRNSEAAVDDGRALDPPDHLGVGVGWEIGAEGLEWSELFPRISPQARYVETAPLYEAGALDRIRENLDSDFRFILHYSGLSLPAPTGRIEQHFPLLDGLCHMLRSPWFVEDLGYWSIEGTDLGAFLPVILSEESLQTSIANMKALQAGVTYRHLPENPPFKTILGDIHILDYMTRLSRATGSPYLIDVGHLYSYLSITKEDPAQALDRVDWPRVLELHIAGGEMVRGPERGHWIYDDNHSKPILPEVLDLLALILPRVPDVRALTVEVDFNQAERGVDDPLEIAVANFFRAHDVAERWAPQLVGAAATVPPLPAAHAAVHA
jgi:uncharacterized protein (UPF0276 family)